MRIGLDVSGWSEKRFLGVLKRVEQLSPRILWASGHKPYSQLPHQILGAEYCNLSYNFHGGGGLHYDHEPELVRIGTWILPAGKLLKYEAAWLFYVNMELRSKLNTSVWNRGIRHRGGFLI